MAQGEKKPKWMEKRSIETVPGRKGKKRS